MSDLHVVLGASGGAGSALVRELASRGKQVRAVSRSGRGESLPGVEHVRGDASDAESLLRICQGAAVIHHCVNVPYPVWYRELSQIARAVVTVSAATRARLVVMDNLYMYGRPDGPMTEETERRARGKKGRLRAELERFFLDAHYSGRVPVAIGRASDFYGPGANSAAGMLVFAPVLQRGKAFWLGRLDVPHTLSYLPDVAWGLATLAEHDEAFGQVWHLPAAEPVTAREFIRMVFAEAGKPPRLGVISRPMVRLAGLFSPVIRETAEVLYQFEHPFVMDTTRFEKAFGRRVTPHREAIRATLEWYRRQAARGEPPPARGGGE